MPIEQSHLSRVNVGKSWIEIVSGLEVRERTRLKSSGIHTFEDLKKRVLSGTLSDIFPPDAPPFNRIMDFYLHQEMQAQQNAGYAKSSMG